MNDFHRDDQWQREVRDRLLAPWYGHYSRDGRYVFIDKGKLATILQKRYAVDTIIQARTGSAICIEEKIVRWPEDRNRPYEAFALETKSCTTEGREAPGWMVYGEADYLLYCFAQNAEATSIIAYLIEFPALKAWFWPRENFYSQFGPLKTINRTVGRVVPIGDVVAEVRSRRYLIEERKDRPAIARRPSTVRFAITAQQLELSL